MIKEELISINSFIKKTKKDWLLISLTTIAFILVATIYLIRTNHVYEIKSNILIKKNDSKGGMSMAASMMKNFAISDFFGGPSDVYDELQIIGSFTTLRSAAKDLGLNTSYNENSIFSKHDYYNNSPIIVKPIVDYADTLRGSILFNVKVDASDRTIHITADANKKEIANITEKKFPIKMETPYGYFMFEKGPSYKDRDISMKIAYQGYDYTAELLSEKLKVDITNKKANAIGLYYEDSQIKRGKDLLNKLVEVYNSSSTENKQKTAELKGNFLDNRIDIISKDLEDVEKQLEEYKTKNDITNIEIETKVLLEKNGDFKEKLIELHSEYEIIESIESSLLKPEGNDKLLPMTNFVNTEKYNELILQRIKVLNKVSENSDAVIDLNNQIREVRRNILASIKTKKQSTKIAINKLQEEEAKMLSKIKDMPFQEKELINLYRQKELKQGLYLYLLQQREETNLAKSVELPQTQDIDKAFVPSKPIKPKKPVIIIIALFAGLGFGIIASYTKNYLLAYLRK